MHNALFNQINIHTYHPESLVRGKDSDGKEIKWNYLTRDLWSEVGLLFNSLHIDPYVALCLQCNLHFLRCFMFPDVPQTYMVWENA